jgi:hypothetical protein
MDKKKEALGYYAEDVNIYCVECINKNDDILKKSDYAVVESILLWK